MDREKLLKDIEVVQDALSGTYVSDEEYDKLLNRLSELNDLLESLDRRELAKKEAEQKRKSEKWANIAKVVQTGMTVGGGVFCVGLIVCAETAVPKILNSKGLGTALKLVLTKTA